MKNSIKKSQKNPVNYVRVSIQIKIYPRWQKNAFSNKLI